MSVFDIIGPIMTGPSSSHTAGAVKIGKIANKLFADDCDSIDIYFHGSFAHTHKGHGTDRAIIGGVLGMDMADEYIKESLQKAANKNIVVNFHNTDLGDVHPNTAKIVLANKFRTLSVLASSIGGGNIIVSRIDGYDVNIKGELPTLWVLHEDRPGEIAAITTLLAENKINIAFMRVFRKNRGGLASSILELDQNIGQEINNIEEREDVKRVAFIPPLD